MGNLADLWVWNSAQGRETETHSMFAEIVFYSAKMKVCNGVESVLHVCFRKFKDFSDIYHFFNDVFAPPENHP